MSILLIVAVVAAKNNTPEKNAVNSAKILQEGSGWKAPAFVDKLTNRLTDLKAAAKKGKEIFDVQCAICHGPKGKGDGAAGMGLTPRPANLTSERVQSQSDGAIYWKITTGNPPMASYKGTFSKKQRWELVTFIRTLGKKESN
ncbi:MAG: cytochrome c [Chlorobi bacterium]|nr:cytochrome c [Chlorobiota bacterium]